VEDPVNPDLLYTGTDHGTYLTLDGGKTWHLFSVTIPNVANYDMIVHPRDNELVIATHGRSIYIADVKPLQALRGDKTTQPIVAFDPVTVQHNRKWGEKEYEFQTVSVPSVAIQYYVGKTGNKPIGVEIRDPNGKMIRRLTGVNQSGFQVVKWDLMREGSKTRKGEEPKNLYVQPGTYNVQLINGTATAETSILVK
jgi:hypothetical protein